MSDFKLRRETPPPATRKVGDSSKIDREVKHLQKNAGTWFKVREAASSGAYIVYKRRGCETRTKTVEGNKYDIWAMWPADTDED